MTQNRQFLKNSLILMASELVVRLKSFIFLPIIAKIFGAVSYGIWAQVTVLQNLISPLVVFGLDSSAMRFMSGQDRETQAQSFTTILSFVFIVSSFFAIIIMAASPFIAESFFGSQTNAKFVLLCAPAIMFASLVSLSKCYIIINNQAKLLGSIKIVEAFLPVIPLAIILVLGLSLFYLISAEIFVIFLVALLCLIILHKQLGFKTPDYKILPKFLKFGAAVMPAGYAMWILNLSDRLFIAKFCGMAELGIYSAAYSFGYLFINIFFNPFWTMYPARASEFYNLDNLEGLHSLFKTSTKVVLFFLVPTIFALGVLGKPIMRVFTTEEFVRGGNLIVLITLGYFMHMFASYFTINLNLANKPIFSTINISVCSLINLIMNYFLIRSFGIAGAAVSTCASFLLNFIIEVYLATRFSKTRLKIDCPSFIKTIISSSIMTIALLLYQPQEIHSLINLVIAGIIGGTIYLFSQFILKFIHSEEAVMVLEILKLERYSQSFLFRYVLLYLRH